MKDFCLDQMTHNSLKSDMIRIKFSLSHEGACALYNVIFYENKKNTFSADIQIFHVLINAIPNEAKTEFKLVIEDRSPKTGKIGLETYCWKAFGQYFGVYSPIIHSERTQWTTGVGENANKNRRVLKKKMVGGTLDRYIPTIIQHEERNWSDLVIECEATVSAKKRRNPKGRYRDGYSALTSDELLVKDAMRRAVDVIVSAIGTVSRGQIRDSLKEFDTECEISWADSTWKTKLSKVEGNSGNWIPETKSKKITKIFIEWSHWIQCKDKGQILNHFYPHTQQNDDVQMNSPKR